MKPKIGDIVIFTGLPSNGINSHPAIITRVISYKYVNLTTFLDRNSPTSIAGVSYNSTGNGWRYQSSIRNLLLLIGDMLGFKVSNYKHNKNVHNIIPILEDINSELK